MVCNPFLAVVSGMEFEAEIVQSAGNRVIYGLDPQKLERDIKAAIEQGAMGLLSFGAAAGLLPELAPGAVIVARTVLWKNQAWQTDEAWTARLYAALPEARLANVAGVDMPLMDAAQKALLQAETGAVAADMESYLVARLAQRHHLPFAVLRVVLDGAEFALPPAALDAMRSDGGIAYSGLLRSLLGNPGQMPVLRQLAADSREAKKSLLRCGALLRGLFVMDFG